MKKLIYFIIALFLLTFLSGCTGKPAKGYPGRIMVLSLSSDGRYVISSDFSQHVVLWDLLKHKYKVIANKANIYSAYFIKNTHDFIYQSNRNNKVYVENVDGKVIKKFNPGFPTYGQVMTSNLHIYFASDEEFNVFKIENKEKQIINVSYCSQDHNGKPYQGPATHACTGFISAGKLLNLTLTPKDDYLTGAGNSRVYIWYVSTGIGKIIMKNDDVTAATITPNGKFILSSDDNGNDLLLNIKTGEVIKKFDFGYNPKLGLNFDKIYGPYTNEYIGWAIVIKFVDNNHFIAIFHNMPAAMNHAGLFSLNQTKAIKYLPLTNSKNHLAPVTQNYTRNQAIDTSPSAHILVMAQRDNNGILVYKYNPKQQTLKQIWAPVIT